MTILLPAQSGATGGSPLNWPEGGGEPEMAFHCAAVLSAFGHAYDVAADLSGREAVPYDGPPDPLIQLAGGTSRLGEIADHAIGFYDHAESLARTSFYPRLVGDGTPYLADDGRELMLAVQSCVDRFEL